jgi:hypothetical protein
MVSADTDKLLKELQEFYKETVRRMENMVRGFSYEIAVTAIQNTPLGDSVLYRELYMSRQAPLPQVEGLARGGWQVSNDGTLEFQSALYGRDSGSAAASAAKIHLMNYKLGEVVLIGNKGPYIAMLEDNYSDQTAGQGIMQPTISSIMAVQQASLLRHYQQG